MLNSGWRKQWPANCSLLEATLLATAGRVPYSASFVVWDLQLTLRAILSMRKYVPLRDFSIFSIIDQFLHPYSRIDSTVAWKKRFFRSGDMLDFQIFFIP